MLHCTVVVVDVIILVANHPDTATEENRKSQCRLEEDLVLGIVIGPFLSAPSAMSAYCVLQYHARHGVTTVLSIILYMISHVHMLCTCAYVHCCGATSKVY